MGLISRNGAEPFAASLFDALTDVVFLYPLRPDGPGTIKAYNGPALEAYGYAPEEMDEMTIADIIEPGSVSIPDAIQQLRRDRRASFESIHRTKAGRRLHMATNARLIEYDGELCVLAVCRDESENRAFQHDLARANLRLERQVEERTREIEAFAEDLRILHAITSSEHASPEARFDAFLRAGCEMFGMPLGILSSTRTDPGTDTEMYRVEATVSPDPDIEAGLEVPLAEAFCDAVIETQATVTYADARAEAPAHPACVQRGLRAFIGTPLWVEGCLYGTVNFASPEARAGGFSGTDRDLIEIMATAIGHQLALDRAATESTKALAWHRAIAHAVEDAVLHVDREGAVVEHNEAARSLLTASGDRIVPRSAMVGGPIPDADLPETVALRERRRIKGSMQSVGDGEGRRYFVVNAAPVDADADGEHDHAVVVFRDVTRFQELATNAERARDMLWSVLEASPEGVMAFQAVRGEAGEIVDFEWLVVNPKGYEITKKTGTHLPGRRLLDVFPGNKDAGLFDAYVRVVEQGETFQTLVPYAHDGFETSFELTAVPLLSEDGFTVTFVDVAHLNGGSAAGAP